ncbi:MAG: hypothetical protein DI589_12045 [Shinella sp.]|nr:MAG: hypothetical protein DI589_12045 [Shinella sp.]
MTEAVQEFEYADASAVQDAQAPAEPAVVDAPAQDAAPAEPVKTDEPAVEDGKEADKGQTWPDDWREKLADGDDAFLKVLKRYSSPSTFAKGFQEREALIRSGKLKQAKPEGGDEKAMAAWRKENGIPDDPTGYAVPEAVQKFLTDGDKPIVAGWLEQAHAAGFTQDQAQQGLEWYTKTIATLEEARAAQDNSARDACEDYLRKEWSHSEFKANNQLATRFLSDTPLGAEWADLRMADGTRLGDNPKFVMWAADQGRQSFGDVSFATGDNERRFADRKAEIEKIRATDFERYDNDKAMRKEYQDIIDAELRRDKATRR